MCAPMAGEALRAGSVLTGLVRNIDPSLTGVKFGEAADWEKLAALGLETSAGRLY